MVVYLDVYFGLNMWMDLLLLAVTIAVCRERPRVGRLLAAAVVGAVGACGLLCLKRKWQLLGMIVMALVMVRIVFPHMRRAELIRAAFVYICAAIFLGGALDWWYFEAVGERWFGSYGVGILGAAVAAVSFIAVALKRRRKSRERDVYRVLVSVSGRDIITAGFLDTGNVLTDGLGRPVHIMEAELLGECEGKLESFSLECSTLAGEGRIAVVRADRLVVPELGIDECGALMGLSERRLFRDGRCHVLLNGAPGKKGEET